MAPEMTDEQYRELREFFLDLANPKDKPPSASSYTCYSSTAVADPLIPKKILTTQRNLARQWARVRGVKQLEDVYDLAITPPFKKCTDCNFTYITDDTIYDHIVRVHLSD
jgi:hypothetical protein